MKDVKNMRLISNEFINILKKYSLGFQILSTNINPLFSGKELLYDMCMKNSTEIAEIVAYIEEQRRVIDNIMKTIEDDEEGEEVNPDALEKFTGLRLVIDNSNNIQEEEKTE